MNYLVNCNKASSLTHRAALVSFQANLAIHLITEGQAYLCLYLRGKCRGRNSLAKCASL